MTVNAIYEWTDADVWDFIRDRKIEVNPLYAKGYSRIGCILCPLARKSERQRDINLYPTYKKAYINAFQKITDAKGYDARNGKWIDGESMFDWWIESTDNPDQLSLDLTQGNTEDG